MPEARLFALDQNFPLPILEALDEFMEEAELVHLPDIDDPRLTAGMDDWQVLLGLHHHERPWDGLITTDDMTALPRELCTIMATKLTLVVAQASGHDPLKATGLLLAHLPTICTKTNHEVGQVWRLRTATKGHEEPWELLRGIAEHRSQSLDVLYSEARLSRAELETDPLS